MQNKGLKVLICKRYHYTYKLLKLSILGLHLQL